jgi:catechol 2,3-dioxygenase-like lactoylglutathione lyase family enzyme
VTQPVVNHIGQCVTDLERATRFWCDVLGFTVDRPDLVLPDEAVGPVFGIDGPVGLTARYLRLGEHVHELIRFDRPGNPPARRREITEPGLTHVSVCVEDLGATLAAAREHGAEVSFESPHVAVLRDPDGQLIEVLPMSYRASLPS